MLTSFQKFQDHWWYPKSLVAQFVVAGGTVSLVAMLCVGAVVTTLIEDNVTRHAGATTALYVDSVIAPLLPDMQRSETLDAAVKRALDETLAQGALGNRLLSFRLWHRDGTIVYSNDQALVGKQIGLSENLRTAFSGRMVAEFEQLDDIESTVERESGLPLLEIYNPVLQPWTGEVVAVLEFYEVATELQRDLSSARVRSWLAVAGVIAGFFMLLSVIVLRGSRMIDRQRADLQERVQELSKALRTNEDLRARVQGASQRAVAYNERYLRRIGADLHDGPAQLVAFAALRLDSEGLIGGTVEGREKEAASIRVSLDEAMTEIRDICRGLVLPHIETAGVDEILRSVVEAYEHRSGKPVTLTLSEPIPKLTPSEKICVYRFVQEGLNNGFRHADGRAQRVLQSWNGMSFRLDVGDSGAGFDADVIPQDGLGLIGLRERVESVGGQFAVVSSASGTNLTMIFDRLDEKEEAIVL